MTIQGLTSRVQESFLCQFHLRIGLLKRNRLVGLKSRGKILILLTSTIPSKYDD